MENENRLNYLKHCYKEIFNDKTHKKWVQNIGLRETYDYLIRRAEKAKTEQEFKYVTAILKRYVKMWKDDYEEHYIWVLKGNFACGWSLSFFMWKSPKARRAT